jgi:hypothetical protein
MNRFSRSCAPYRVSKLAALAQAPITLGSANSPEHREQLKHDRHFFKSTFYLSTRLPPPQYTLHAKRIQIFTMSSSSAPSNLSDSNSPQSDTLLQNEIIEEHSKDSLLHPANAPPHLADALLYSGDSPTSLLQEDTRSTMPPRNRSAGRNVHIFDTSDRNTSIGGLVLTAGITNANLYTMIEIFVIFNGEYILRNESNIIIKRDDSLLLSGNYYIDSSHKFFFDAFFL